MSRCVGVPAASPHVPLRAYCGGSVGIATARLAWDDRPDRHTHLLVCPELVHTAEQRGDQIQGGVNLGFATAKDVSVEVRIAHPYDRIPTHGGRQW